MRPRGVSAISLASQAAKCDSCFFQSAQSTTPSGGAAMPKACFSSNYSVSQPVPPAGKFSFYGIIVPQFFRPFLHKMMKDFLRQHRTIKAAALCGNFMSWLCCDFTVIHQVLPQNRALSARKICSQIALVQLCGIALRQCKYIAWFCLFTDVLCREIDISGSYPCIWQSKEI